MKAGRLSPSKVGGARKRVPVGGGKSRDGTTLSGMPNMERQDYSMKGNDPGLPTLGNDRGQVNVSFRVPLAATSYGLPTLPKQSNKANKPSPVSKAYKPVKGRTDKK